MTWNDVYSPYIWPMLASTVVSAVLAIYAWRFRVVPGGAAFGVQNLGIAMWAVFTAMEMAAANLPTLILHHKLEAASAIISMGGLIYFAFEHSSLAKYTTRRNALLLSFITLCFLILMATNDLHHLFWTGFYFDRFLRVDRGPLNFLLMAWAFVLPMLALKAAGPSNVWVNTHNQPDLCQRSRSREAAPTCKIVVKRTTFSSSKNYVI